MYYFADSLAELIEQFAKLPGIGPKTAQRLAFHILRGPKEDAHALAKALVRAREGIRTCSVCNNLTDIDPCKICRNPNRDKTVLCVVEDVRDVVALEKAGAYRGYYHVLNGTISPMQGIGPEKLKIEELLARVKKGGIEEVIIATNSGMDGETTSLYLAKVLKPYQVKVTRIAQGLPVGSDLEYADQLTLSRAFQGRTEC